MASGLLQVASAAMPWRGPTPAHANEKRMPRRPEGAPGIRKLILAGPVTWTEPCQE